MVRYDRIIELLDKWGHISNSIHWLLINKSEEEVLKNKYCRYLNMKWEKFNNAIKNNTSDGSEKEQIVITILKSVITSQLPLIAFELVCNI